MSTPTSLRVHRKSRRSSVLAGNLSIYNSNLDSPRVNSSLNHIAENGSAKKQSKNINVINMNKELQRKQNQYKTQKEKRAHLFEKVRHINTNEEENDEDEDFIESKNNLTDIKEQVQEEFKEKQAIEETIIDSKKETTATTTTKFGSSILNKMNYFKNTLKNIVSNSSNNKNKLTTATITSTTSNPTITVTHTVEDTHRAKVKSFMNSTVSSKSKLNANTRQQEHKENLSKALNNLDSKIITQQHKRLQDNVMTRSISASQIGHSNKRVIRKQESTASVSSKKNHLESTSSTNSTLNPANSTTLVNGKPGAKPVFRITKIKYDDRHLFDTVI